MKLPALVPLLLVAALAPASAQDGAGLPPSSRPVRTTAPTTPPSAPGRAAPRPATRGPEVRGHIDWQAHPAMHIPFKVLGEGLTEDPPENLSWRHQFRQTLYAPHLRASGVRIFVAAAVAAEATRKREKALALIEDQLDFVEDFVARDPAFAMARTPAEARRLLRETNKIVVVHSIEGARWVLDSPADAERWRRRGVAVITLIHLRDDEFGGAGLNPGVIGALTNLKGASRNLLHPNRSRGLTDHGRDAIRWLADAGILVDLTHMTSEAVDDSLAHMRAHGIPPVVTHGCFAPIRAGERGFTPRQVLEIYRLGGTFSLPIAGGSLDPRRPTIAVPRDLRRGTLDSFAFHHQTLQNFLRAHAGHVLGQPGRTWAHLTDAERTRLALGWASDWNGFLNHSKPTATKREVRRAERRGDGDDYLDVDVLGLAHPGLLPQYFQRLEEAGLDLDPMLRSAERFLQLWEGAVARQRRVGAAARP